MFHVRLHNSSLSRLLSPGRQTVRGPCAITESLSTHSEMHVTGCGRLGTCMDSVSTGTSDISMYSRSRIFFTIFEGGDARRLNGLDPARAVLVACTAGWLMCEAEAAGREETGSSVPMPVKVWEICLAGILCCIHYPHLMVYGYTVML